MKISDAILALQNQLDTHGDADLVTSNMESVAAFALMRDKETGQHDCIVLDADGFLMFTTLARHSGQSPELTRIEGLREPHGNVKAADDATRETIEAARRKAADDTAMGGGAR